MVRAVVSKFNSWLALKFVHEIALNINDLHYSAELLDPEQSPANHTCYGIYFPANLRCYRSIEVNSTWIFFWISKCLISFAWDLLAFNVNIIFAFQLFMTVRL